MEETDDALKRKYGEGCEDSATKKSKFDHGGTQPLLKLLIPSGICGHVIGKAGSYIAELKTKYGGHIMISGVKDCYPGTNERVLLIKGAQEEINNLNYQIMERMTTGTFILPDGRGDKTKILLTPLGAGMIIGKGGATIKQIKEQSGAKMIISNSLEGDFNGERVLTISGSIDERAEASRLVAEQVAEEPSNMANTRLKYEGMMQQSAFPQDNCVRPPQGMLDKFVENHHHQQMMPRSPVGVPPPRPQSMNGGGIPHIPSGGLPHIPSTCEVKMDIPSFRVGYIMGKGGQGVKEISRRSNGAKLVFEGMDTQDNTVTTRKLTITGTFEQVHIAFDMVHNKVYESIQMQQQQQHMQNQLHQLNPKPENS